jgi:peptide/nickel transport system substrate-binding protein/oligopeptide transport system substrate-binding protein
MRSRTFRLIAALAAALAAAGVPAAAPDARGYLIYRMPDDPPTLDPIRASEENSAVYVVNLFDGLVEFAPGGVEIVPAVAESWTVSPDGLTYTFRLRKGVKFHGGREVAAADVVYSLKRVLDPGSQSNFRPFLELVRGAAAYAAGKSSDLPGLAAPDPATVRIVLERPFGPFLSVLASQAGSIVPPEVYADPNEGYLGRPVGCGPFRFESWDRGVSLSLAAFPGHWKGRPGLPGVTFRFISDAATALEEYRSGGLDLTNEVPAGRRDEIRTTLASDYRVWPRLAVATLSFNHRIPPFEGNAALRRAAACTVDRDRIARVLQNGKDRPATRLLPPEMLGHAAEPGPIRYDLAEARRLLAEAGHPEGRGLPEFTYLTPSNEAIVRWSQAILADLKAAGFKVRLKTLDFGAYTAAIQGAGEEGPPAALFNLIWFADYPDPDNFLRLLLHSGVASTAGNFGRYRNAEVDRLLEEARHVTDPAARAELYRKAEDLALAEAALVPIYHYGDDALVKPNVAGLRPSPLGDYAIPLELLRLGP